MNYQDKVNEALRNLALNQIEKCEKNLQKLIKSKPRISTAYGLLGILNFQYKKNFQLAQNYLNEAVNLKSNDVNVYLILGVIEINQKKFEKAKEHLIDGLSLNRGNRDILFNLGIVYSELNDFETAKKHYIQCVNINNNDLPAKLNLANLYSRMEDYSKAEEIYRELEPLNQTIILKSYWSLLYFLRKYTEALSIIKKIISLEDNAANKICLLKNYVSLRNYNEAVALINELDIDNIELNFLVAKNEYYAQNYYKSLEIQEKYLKHLESNESTEYLDLYLKTLLGIQDAEFVKAKFEHMINNSLDNQVKIDCKYHYGVWNLNNGNYQIGFEYTINRLSKSKIELIKPDDIPTTEQLNNKKILLIGDMGIGDQIFYLNFVDYLLNFTSKITILVDQRLIPLATKKYKTIEFLDKSQYELIKTNKYFDDFDIINFLGNLPLFNISNLLQKQKTNKINDKENNKNEINKIGISWNSKHPLIELDKSIPLDKVKELIKNYKNYEFVNLQYDNEEDIKNLKQFNNFKAFDDVDKKNDMEGLAKLINTCDMVITVSNTTAHLCGFLGKKTLLVIPNQTRAFWFWKQLNNNYSVWYPTIKVVNIKLNDMNLLVNNLNKYI